MFIESPKMARSFAKGFFRLHAKPDTKPNPRRTRLPRQHPCRTACHRPSKPRPIQPRRVVPSGEAHPMRIPTFVRILFTSNYSDSDPFRLENKLSHDTYSQNPMAALGISGNRSIPSTFSTPLWSPAPCCRHPAGLRSSDSPNAIRAGNSYSQNPVYSSVL
jgi:hypothetical protein